MDHLGLRYKSKNSIYRFPQESTTPYTLMLCPTLPILLKNTAPGQGGWSILSPYSTKQRSITNRDTNRNQTNEHLTDAFIRIAQIIILVGWGCALAFRGARGGLRRRLAFPGHNEERGEQVAERWCVDRKASCRLDE